MRELFSHDPDTGMTVWAEITDNDVVFEYEQDVEPYLEENKKLQNEDGYTKAGIKDEFWHYASIPNAIHMKWLIEEGLDVYDKNAMPQILKKLNDPQYRYLKATTKVHSKQVFKGIIVDPK